MNLGALVERSAGSASGPMHGQVERFEGTTHVMVNPLVADPDVPHHYKLCGAKEQPLVKWPRSVISRYANITDMHSLRAHRRAWNAMGIRIVSVSARAPDRFVYHNTPAHLSLIHI